MDEDMKTVHKRISYLWGYGILAKQWHRNREEDDQILDEKGEGLCLAVSLLLTISATAYM